MSGVAMPRDTATAWRSRVRVPLRGLAVAALVIAAGTAGAAYARTWWIAGRFVESTDDAYIGGNITALSPHVAGFVTEILVADNTRVQAGQVLLRLDARDRRAELDHARAEVDARLAALANLRAQDARQQSTIQQAIADCAGRTARAAFARIDGARYTTLALSRSGSRQDAQRAAVSQAEAEAALAASTAGLQAARQQLKIVDAQTAEAAAAITQARADLTLAGLRLGYTEIRAPVEGYVGNRAAQLGAYVSEGTYLLSIIPAHGLWVDANFKEDQLARMAPGQAASVTADGAPGMVFHGRVASLAPGTGAVFSVIPPENATGNFIKIVQRVPVRIVLDAADALDRLRPGLSVIARVDTRTR